MQLGLFVVVVFLSSMDLTGSSKVMKGKRQRRSMYETLFFSPPDAARFLQMVNVKAEQSSVSPQSSPSPTPMQGCALPCPTGPATALSCRRLPWQLTPRAAPGRGGEMLPPPACGSGRGCLVPAQLLRAVGLWRGQAVV